MTSGQLEALLTVAECGSMNKAAELLFISQPALKKRLDSLENELGFSLFERSVNGSILTEAGSRLCVEIKPLFIQMKSVIEKMQGSVSPMKIRIGQLPFLTLRFCDQLIAEFLHEHSHISVERTFMPNAKWLEPLYAGDIDMCFAPGTVSSTAEWNKKGLTCIQYSEGQLACFVSSYHPLACHSQISLKDLSSYPVFAEPLMMKYSGLSEYAKTQHVQLKTDQSVFNRYEMIDSCNQGAVYIHDISLAPDMNALTHIPITDFSYGRFILLRKDDDKKPANRIMKSFLLKKGYHLCI